MAKHMKQPKPEPAGSGDFDEDLRDEAKEFLRHVFADLYYERWIMSPQGQRYLHDACIVCKDLRKFEERINRRQKVYHR